jgi:hypothetical protein
MTSIWRLRRDVETRPLGRIIEAALHATVPAGKASTAMSAG